MKGEDNSFENIGIIIFLIVGFIVTQVAESSWIGFFITGIFTIGLIIFLNYGSNKSKASNNKDNGDKKPKDEWGNEKITQKDIVFLAMITFIEKKAFKAAKDFGEKQGDNFILSLSPRHLGRYNLYLGASYQELGEIKIADKYFDIFLNSLRLSDAQLKDCEELNIEEEDAKMIFLIKELEELGLTYKM